MCEEYHLYRNEDGDVYAAPNIDKAMLCFVKDTGEYTIESEWDELPDDKEFTDESGYTSNAKDHAEEYYRSHGTPGCVGLLE